MIRVVSLIMVFVAGLAGAARAERFGNFDVQAQGAGAVAQALDLQDGGGLRFGCNAPDDWFLTLSATKNLYAGKEPLRPIELVLDVEDVRFGPYQAQHKGKDATLAGAEALGVLQALQLRGRVRVTMRASQGYQRSVQLRLDGVEDATLAVARVCGPFPKG